MGTSMGRALWGDKENNSVTNKTTPNQRRDGLTKDSLQNKL